MPEFPKIAATHLRRQAYVYIRQSTVTQVRTHTESLERQYELRERAVALGWPVHQVTVIDEDLGISGAHSSTREGFKGLVADVGLGKVGIVLGIEVSRLARNNADWYHLLDLCALTDTLIADQDGVYHPGEYNDRLVLGLKGTMSEAELHLIRNRLTAGLRHKAAKGELRQWLPVGLDYDADGNVVLSADEAVRAAIAEVFRRYAEIGSARQVLLSLRGDGLLVPRRTLRTGRISWADATYPSVHDFLTNPAYGGAFVFGRFQVEKRVGTDGTVVVRTRQMPRDQWTVLIPDHHPGYISWETYEANVDRLRRNWRAARGEASGGVREGRALLQGRVRCGRCGRNMKTGYSGATGNCPRYTCSNGSQLYGSGPLCQSLGGIRLESRVLDQVFAVLEPAALTATAGALAEAEARHRDKLHTFELAVERAGYEAERARRQFDLCEPENRLVARTLERAWDDKLVELRRVEAELVRQRAHRPTALTSEELAWLERAGADVRAVFEAPTTTWRERKQLLRVLIADVIVTVRAAEHEADVRIVWEGGAVTEFTMALNRRGGHYRQTDESTVDLVRRLAKDYDDKTIAMTLSRQGRTTGTGLSFNKTRVANLRHSRNIPRYVKPVTAPEEDGLVVSVSQAERQLGVNRTTIYRWLRDGFIIGEQTAPEAPWRIRLDSLKARLAPDVPEGWLRLDEAARVLGVARQTVLHKVQRGELNAVHVNQGRRRGLRIEVIRPTTGLFDQPE